MKRDRFYYSANLAGLTVLLYLALSTLLRTGVDALLGFHLAGAGISNPLGLSETVIQLINCLCTFINLALPLWLLLVAERRLGLALPSGRVKGDTLCLLLMIFLLYTTACTALVSGLRTLLSHGGYQAPASASLPESGIALFFALISTCVLPAIGEELLFRGALQTLLRRWGDWFAIVVTSLFFALLHRDLSQLLSIFAISLFLGYTAFRFKSLVPCIVLHLANNLSSFVLLWARSRMDATSALGLSVVLFTLYIACGALSLILAYRRRLFAPLPRYAPPPHSMSRAERLIYAPVYDFALLLLIITAIMEYFR